MYIVVLLYRVKYIILLIYTGQRRLNERKSITSTTDLLAIFSYKLYTAL